MPSPMPLARRFGVEIMMNDRSRKNVANCERFLDQIRNHAWADARKNAAMDKTLLAF